MPQSIHSKKIVGVHPRATAYHRRSPSRELFGRNHYPSSLSLDASELQQDLRLLGFDFQMRLDGSNNVECRPVAGLPTKERTPLVGVGLLRIVPAAKFPSDKPNGRFVHHSDLDARMIRERDASLAFVRLCLLDSNVTFTVYDTRNVRKINRLGHIASLSVAFVTTLRQERGDVNGAAPVLGVPQR